MRIEKNSGRPWFWLNGGGKWFLIAQCKSVVRKVSRAAENDVANVDFARSHEANREGN